MTKNGKKGNGSWKDERKSSDPFLKDPKPTDLVLPIMGPTGAGKSTFINTFIGATVAKVGHDLQSETAQVQHYIFPLNHPKYPGRRLILIDTPGFDDTTESDHEILRRIAVWLAQSYDADMTLAGVVYLHEITQTRMLGTARKNLDMFNKLCGADATKNVILATTKWGDVTEEVGKRRVKQLEEEHWTEVMGQGARMGRFDVTASSAHRIVNSILERPPVKVSQIQKELVEIDKFLPDTEAGRTLRFTLKELLEIQKEMAARLREQGGEETRQQIHDNDEKIRSTLQQIKLLGVPMSKRIKRFFSSSDDST